MSESQRHYIPLQRCQTNCKTFCPSSEANLSHVIHRLVKHWHQVYWHLEPHSHTWCTWQMTNKCALYKAASEWWSCFFNAGLFVTILASMRYHVSDGTEHLVLYAYEGTWHFCLFCLVSYSLTVSGKWTCGQHTWQCTVPTICKESTGNFVCQYNSYGNTPSYSTNRILKLWAEKDS